MVFDSPCGSHGFLVVHCYDGLAVYAYWALGIKQL